MTVILLPTSPLPKQATPRPLDFGMWQEPIAGSTISRLDRPGNRLAVDYQTPSLKPEPDGRIWASRLLQAVGQPVRMPFPQPGIVPGNPGVAVVDGAGQGGIGLALRNMTPTFVLVEGRAFNVYDADGTPYLHLISSDVTVGFDGKVIVTCWPMLRTSPADGSTVNFAAPVIQGRLTGNEKGWTYIPALVQSLQFSIDELK